MKLPKMLDDYLEDTAQIADDMTAAELFEEASWVLAQYKSGDLYGDTEYTKKDAAALRAFITRISSKMVRR